MPPYQGKKKELVNFLAGAIDNNIHWFDTLEEAKKTEKKKQHSSTNSTPIVSLEGAKYVPTKHNFQKSLASLDSLVRRFILKIGKAITTPFQLGLGLN